jgi:hypothetical protein
VRPCLPWLSQGDFFTDLPQHETEVEVLLGRRIDLRFPPRRGPALLITYSSVIDKRTHSAQRPQTSRFQFCPVHSLEAAGLTDDQMRRLRNGERDPAEAVYLDLGEGQEGLALLSEAFVVPTEFFGLELRHFPDHPEADPADPHHVCASDNDTRALSMEPEELAVLLRKMAFYWTRSELQ